MDTEIKCTLKKLAQQNKRQWLELLAKQIIDIKQNEKEKKKEKTY